MKEHLELAIETIQNLPAHTEPKHFSELQKLASEILMDANAGEPLTGLNARNEVERLWLRGQLFRYLNSGAGKNEVPYILYWLALCDRSIGYGYDYTLADFYLKQCVKRYPRHPMARTCFNDYKNYVTFYFTTPLESVLPIEIDRELKELESYLIRKKGK